MPVFARIPPHWMDGMIMIHETATDFALVPCPHDPTGKCNGDHAPDGDYTSANDDYDD